MYIRVCCASVESRMLGDCVYCIIGASLNEPHIDEFAANFPYIYIWRMSCRKSLLAIILRVLASFVIPKTVHKL